jgi:hypothetical protein
VRTASIIRAIIALMMEAVRTNETSVYVKDITRSYIPDGLSSSYSALCEPKISQNTYVFIVALIVNHQ